MTFEVLDSAETAEALAGRNIGRSNPVLREAANGLATVVNTDSSIFVTDFSEQMITSLRTKMQRQGIAVSVTKTIRNGKQGHVLRAKSRR